jgi:hypothetical protein
MKTLGRILMILLAFAVVMGIAYVAVKAGNSATASTVPAFEGASQSFPPNGERSEFRGQSEGSGGWIFGMTKNVAVVVFIVALITAPKNLRQKKRKTISMSVG